MRYFSIHLSLLIIAVFVLPNNSFAQGEGNIWYFGHHAGLDFNSGSPVAITDGAIITEEGCASISDIEGDLLFYTDGSTVWNRNHQPMPNGTGLFGDASSTQSGIIVQKPGQQDIYLIFTVTKLGGSDGLRYSEVDMSLDGGLGDVSSKKNIFLASEVCEKVTALKHSNDADIWIITHAFNSDEFKSFLLTSDSVSQVPVISKTGTFITGNSSNTMGYLKGSGDNSWVVNAITYMDLVELFKFDNSTGVLTAGTDVSQSEITRPYGVEFSPDGRLLYISERSSETKLFQYDLSSGSMEDIIKSQFLVGNGKGKGGALQLGPDLRIYFAESEDTTIGVINFPNVYGENCNYEPGVIQLKGKECGLGLPNIYRSFFLESAFSFKNLCYGDSTLFFISSGALDSVRWNFGDPASGINNTSSQRNPVHVFSDTGAFQVVLISYLEAIIDTSRQTIQVKPIPEVDIGNDTLVCSGESLTLDATYPGASYTWLNDSSTLPSKMVNEDGIYMVKVTLNKCISYDTIDISHLDSTLMSLGPDTFLCEEDSFLVLHNKITDPTADFYWSNGSSKKELTIFDPGTYWVETSLENCSLTDTIQVNNKVCKTVYLLPNIFSPNEDNYNDLLKPIENKGVSSFLIHIYNRWGKLVFQTNDSNINWKGNDSNDPNTAVPDGIYFWQAEYQNVNKEIQNQKGTIKLVR